MGVQRPLTPDGKPMRALRALAEMRHPAYEAQIHVAARRDFYDTSYYHDALRTLVVRGYATVTGPRGGQRYEITNKGRGLLEAA